MRYIRCQELESVFGAKPPASFSKSKLEHVLETLRGGEVAHVELRRLPHEGSIARQANWSGTVLPSARGAGVDIAGGLLIPPLGDLVSGPFFRAMSSGFLRPDGVVLKINGEPVHNTRKESIDLMFDSKSTTTMTLTVFIPKGSNSGSGDPVHLQRLEEDSKVGDQEFEYACTHRQLGVGAVTSSQRRYVGALFTDSEDDRMMGAYPNIEFTKFTFRSSRMMGLITLAG